MIEMHCHLLAAIDDGVKSIGESIDTIKMLVSLGYKKIVITPHYINGTSYNVNNMDKYKLFLELQKRIKEENIDIELYLGNEVFIDESILEDLKAGKCCTINSSRYVLVEISRNDIINNLDNILFKLLNRGIVPIMAHPERYLVVKKDKSVLDDWVNSGVLLQVNFESISGKYGKDAKKLFEYILKNNLASFIGGDIHGPGSDFFKDYEKNKKKILKLIGEDKYNELISVNPLKLINNEDI